MDTVVRKKHRRDEPLDLDSKVPRAVGPGEILEILYGVDASDDDITEARRIVDDMKAHGLRDGGPVNPKNLTYRQINAMLLDGLIHVNKIGTGFVARFDTEPPAALLDWPPVVDPCVVYDKDGNACVRLSDGRLVYVGHIDGDAIRIPRMIGTDRSWPASTIESISDDSRRDCDAVLIIIDIDDSGVRKRITRDAYCSDAPIPMPAPKWPHGLIIDDAGVVTVTVPYPEEGTLARVGHIEVLPPGQSIVFDDPVRRNGKSVRQRLYTSEIVACSWDYEIHGLCIVDKAGRVHRYRATDVPEPSKRTPTMIAHDLETLEAVNDLLETTRHGTPNTKGTISAVDLMDRLGLDARTAHAVLLELCFDDVLERMTDPRDIPKMVTYYRRYDPSRLPSA